MLAGIGAEIAEQHVFLGALRDFQPAIGPEAIEVRDRGLVGAHALAPALVALAQPSGLAAALVEGLGAAEPAREIGEDRKIAARLADWFDRLLHRHHVAVARRAADVVALERRG